jgi:hypothetical protein
MNDTEKKAAPVSVTEAVSMVLSRNKGSNIIADNQENTEENCAEKIPLHKDYSLPIWGLPRYAQDIINDVSEVRQCPRDFATIAVMAAASAAVGKRIQVTDKYDNSLMIWAVIIAPSGSAKSQPLNDIFAPLEAIDARNYRDYRTKLKAWKDAGSDGDKPTYKQLLISDTTPEARNKVLADNSNGVTLYRDEIAGMIEDVGRYNHSGEVAQMLSIFDAKNIVINRKGDEPQLIEKPFLNVIGTIQPDILATTFGRPQLVNNGFVQRFLFVFPDNVEFASYADNKLNDTLHELWSNVILQLNELPSGAMTISKEAKEVYIEFFDKIQAQIAAAENGYQQAALAKLQIQVIRWAGITQLFHVPLDGTLEITPDAMRYAVECMRYFEHTAEKVGELIAGGQPAHKATKGEIVRGLLDYYPATNKAQFAQAIGVSRQAINEFLKK